VVLIGCVNSCQNVSNAVYGHARVNNVCHGTTKMLYTTMAQLSNIKLKIHWLTANPYKMLCRPLVKNDCCSVNVLYWMWGYCISEV